MMNILRGKIVLRERGGPALASDVCGEKEVVVCKRSGGKSRGDGEPISNKSKCLSDRSVADRAEAGCALELGVKEKPILSDEALPALGSISTGPIKEEGKVSQKNRGLGLRIEIPEPKKFPDVPDIMRNGDMTVLSDDGAYLIIKYQEGVAMVMGPCSMLNFENHKSCDAWLLSNEISYPRG